MASVLPFPPSRSAHLDVQVRFAPALVMIRASGELVPSQVHLLVDALDAAGALVEPGRLVVLDLSRVVEYDGAALASLAASLTRLLDNGVELRIKEGPLRAPVAGPRLDVLPDPQPVQERDED